MNKDKIKVFDHVNEPDNPQENQEKTEKIAELHFESVTQATIISYLLS